MVTMPDLSNFAAMVDTLETYAHLLFVALALYYLYLTFKGGDSKKSGKSFGLGPEKGKEAAKKIKEAGKLLKKTEKLDVEEYVYLKELETALSKKITTPEELKKAVDKSEHNEKRKLVKSKKRFHKLELVLDGIGLAEDPKFKPLLTELETFTNTIIAEMEKFDTALNSKKDIPERVKDMKAAIAAAISADRGFMAAAQTLQKALGQ